MQLDHLQKRLLEDLVSEESTEPLFSDSVRLQQINDQHELVSETAGALIAFRDHLSCCGQNIPFDGILGMSIYSRNVLVLHTLADNRHYEIRGDLRFSALKYLYLYEMIKKEVCQ